MTNDTNKPVMSMTYLEEKLRLDNRDEFYTEISQQLLDGLTHVQMQLRQQCTPEHYKRLQGQAQALESGVQVLTLFHTRINPQH